MLTFQIDIWYEAITQIAEALDQLFEQEADESKDADFFWSRGPVQSGPIFCEFRSWLKTESLPLHSVELTPKYPWFAWAASCTQSKPDNASEARPIALVWFCSYRENWLHHYDAMTLATTIDGYLEAFRTLGNKW